MSDILKYRFYLNFKNEDSFGRIEITEPIGFDGASFVVGQDAKRYGRDAYKINEEINLNFYKGNYDPSDLQQLPNGTVVYNLTQGYDFLIDCYNRHGFESNVDFEIELDGLVFIPSNLDFQTCETDGFSYFTCKAVQEQARQIVKRRADIVTNIFSTEDLDGNEVTPAQTQNILLKAKPVRQISKWNYAPVGFTSTNFGFQSFVAFPIFNNLIDFGIDASLTSFATSYTAQLVNEPAFLEQYRQDVTVIQAQADLTDIQIKIRDLSFTSFGDDPVNVVKQLSVNYGTSYVSGEFETILLENETSNTFFNLSSKDYDVTIPFLPNGGFIYIAYSMLGLTPTGGVTPIGSFNFTLTSGSLEINATSTAIDSVIKGVRYIDVFKENIKRINGYEVFAPRFDVGGEYYDQFAFTGSLIKQRDDVAFPVKLKDITEGLQEVNSDYQITDKLYIGRYEDFYANNEIAVFVTPPDDTFKSTFNERYAINQFEYKYKTYEQDREESNTTDAIHTDTQWLLGNTQVENTKTIDIDQIRDAYKIEATRKLGLKDTTSTDDDDKMFLIDVVPLAPSTKGGFTSVLRHNVNSDGNLQLLRTELFTWTLLGFSVGDVFSILDGQNIGDYTILEFDDSIILLEPITPTTPTFTGETFTEVEYPYTSVAFVNRTNEGLEFFDNLINGDDYSNLRYSIKRNIKTWQPYLATASKFIPNKEFKNTYFKDNGECITRFVGESENIQENASILNTELSEAIITPYLYETRLLAPFDQMTALINAIDTVNEDNSIGGFIRCIDNNGKVIRLYPNKLDYLPSTETLTLTGEERFDGEGVNIVISGDTVTINEVGYDVDVLSDPFYEFDGDYFKIYDLNRLPVINPTRYDDITVNGLNFNSSQELLNYLVNN